jgi:hypothetical protein
MTAVLACSSDHTLSADSYDRSCTKDSDCEVVYVGDVCVCCGDQAAAINVADDARYRADVNSADKGCPDIHCSGACVASPPTACIAGSCTVCPYGGCAVEGGTPDAGTDAARE